MIENLKEVRIIIADDHKIFRQGLRNLLEKYSNLKVIAEAQDGASAVKTSLELMPDLVIMDISMPGLNGIEATRQIKGKVNKKIAVIMLSMYSDWHFIIESIKAGATGFLLKDCTFEELTGAIQAVVNNKTYLSAPITDTLIKDYIFNIAQDDQTAFSILTPREREILQLISEGSSTKDIAHNLNISIKTVETHRQQIMEKLNIHSVAELTKYAIRQGITSL